MRYLIVTDMQKDFVDGSLGSEAAVKIVPAVCRKIEEYKAEGGRIICTFDTHYENYSQTLEGKHLPVAHCVKGTAGWALDREVAKALSVYDYLQVKKEVFGSVKLGEYLSQRLEDGDTVEIIGLCTDICVVSNALLIKAYCPETEVYIDEKCCAGTSVEAHNAALETMKSCQCIIK